MNAHFAQVQQIPFHWQLLNGSDIEEYFRIRSSLQTESGKSRKGERRETFINALHIIRNFIEKGDSNDWKRGVVCGIVFLEKTIAINIQQLRLLLGKCKSSINGSLQQLGFSSLPPGREMFEEFLRKVPCFQKESTELKKWTLRECGKCLFNHSMSFQNLSSQNLSKVFICPLPMVNRRVNNCLPVPVVNTQNTQQKINAEVVQKIVRDKFPCPAKFRYKYDNLSTIRAVSAL